MKNRLEEKLQSGILLFDGAVGTEIYRRHVFVNVSFESLCLNRPEIVADIHRSYLEAGAEVLTVNSFAANRNKLARFGLGEEVAAINAAAVKVAREAGGEDILLAGSVGPVGAPPPGTRPGDFDPDGILAEQIEALQEAGPDFLLLETLATLDDIRRAVRVAARTVRLPYVLSLSLDRHAETSRGERFNLIRRVLEKAGRRPEALGLNCGGGPENALSALEHVLPRVDLPLIVRPNAGVPKNVDGRMIFMTSPEYFATYAGRYVQMGVRGVGGCCGTGPEHIRAMVQAIRPLRAADRAVTITEPLPEARLRDPVPPEQRSRLAARLARGEWVTSVELVPPRGWRLDKVVEKSVLCGEKGVDAINIPDGPRASSRISPMVTAHQIQLRAGIETILHVCSRDRNLIGIQADLLGCAALGLANLLFITGDPPKVGDYPFASAVFDADSIGMVKIQDRMNRGLDIGAKPLDPPTAAFIGVGADPGAVEPKRELERLRRKVEAGAEFIITQPVFDPDVLARFLEEIPDLKIPVLAGVWPLASYRNAEFMRNEVPGVVVPDRVMRRMARASSREEQAAAGIAIARETVVAIRDGVAGIQVSAPLGRVATALAVIDAGTGE